MSIVRESGEIGYIERRYWRRTDSFKPWWPWGAVRVTGLVMLYLIGATLTAPQAQSHFSQKMMDWLELVEESSRDTGLYDEGILRVFLPPPSLHGLHETDRSQEMRGVGA